MEHETSLFYDENVKTRIAINDVYCAQILGHKLILLDVQFCNMERYDINSTLSARA